MTVNADADPEVEGSSPAAAGAGVDVEGDVVVSVGADDGEVREIREITVSELALKDPRR